MKNRVSVIDKFAYKIRSIIFLKWFLLFLSGWSFLWGTAILVVRSTFHQLEDFLVWGLTGIPLAVAAAMVVSRKQMPSLEELYAVLDRRNRCGGLLIAAREIAITGWEESFAVTTHPDVVWKGNKILRSFIAGIVFVFLSCYLPQWAVNAGGGHRLDVKKEAENLTKQIETLKQEKIIDTAKAEKIQSQLEQLVAGASGEDPAKTFEAFDHLDDFTAKAANKAAEEGLKQTQELAKAKQMADALAENTDKMDPKSRAEAMKELKDLVKEATGSKSDCGSPNGNLNSTDFGKNNLSSSELKQLSGKLDGKMKEVEGKLVKLQKAKLIDKKMLEENIKAGKKCDDAGFIDDTKGKENEKSKDCVLTSITAVEGFGKGGRDRGRGDAPMTFGDKTKEGKTNYKDEALPPGALDTKNSVMMRMSVGAPSLEAEALNSISGALNSAAAGDGGAHSRVILPVHKTAVKKYFERR